MKPIRIIASPSERQRTRLQLYWSQNSDGDVIAHLRQNHQHLRAGSLGTDPMEALIRFRGWGLTGDGTQSTNLPVHTDEESATLNFKVLTRYSESKSPALPAAGYQERGLRP